MTAGAIHPALLAEMGITQDAAPAARPVQVVDIGALLRVFDGKMHRRMDVAKDEAAWTEVQTILTGAHRHRNLRPNVQERFLKDCPHPEMVAAFREAVGLKALPKKPVVVEDESILIKRFDGRLHGRMSAAQTMSQWEEIRIALINAHREDNLRGGVRERFLKECPHPEIILSLREAIGLPVPGKKSSPVRMGDQLPAPPTESPRKYDGRLHGLIKDAQRAGSHMAWQLACHALVSASADGQLRPGVQKHFTLQCPPSFSELSDQVAKLAVVVSEQVKKDSPLSNKTRTPAEQHAYEARRDEHRAERLKNRPVKGSSNKSDPSGGKGKKGGKKNGSK